MRATFIGTGPECGQKIWLHRRTQTVTRDGVVFARCTALRGCTVFGLPFVRGEVFYASPEVVAYAPVGLDLVAVG